ncbi:MAG TPA: FimB/Mfa2 family fimbrial subunit [Bacteroides mediterraneensis]|uniref:FimB/Mfa2 family fimbrial subunit n=1 Tax=Bacteroides mediterraneensis TaxID=1841856 RepID=UPI0026EF8A4B|nr:FimB/Mfa2 family fimbrial subunit [Bacteroides mediterraneensis]HJH65938.1 FimB/Mfa2 family fimbrial subunit [Bacteroides mediterraneensis]
MELRIQTHLFFALWACILFLWGCGTYQVDDDTETVESSGPYVMDVALSNASLFTSLYPLQLYLFDSKGATVWNEEVQAQTEWPVLSQPTGDYVLAAISGLSSEDYLPPMSLNAKQLLTFSQGNCADTPLVIGKNVVKLKNDVKISMNLSYAVAALYLSFGGVSDDAIAVEARISPVSSGITLEGNWNNDGQFASVPCQKVRGIWKAGPVYVFPSESSQTHLSLNVKTASGETVYGYFFSYPLEAGKPYRFVSTGDGEVSLEGNGQIEGWTPEVSEEFPFENMTPEEDWDNPQPDVPDGDENPEGEEEENGGTSDENGDNGDVMVAEVLPESGSIWGPFFVWKVESVSSNEVEATLVSPRQWLLKKAEAVSVCTAYEVDGISGWRTLTTEEAEEFREQYASTLEELNEILQENGIDSFDKYDCRYLCNNLNSTFCFYNNKILNSGETVDYALRLVKKVRVEKAK